MQFRNILDGTSNTIMIVEANDDHAVTWTAPEDFKPERKDPTVPLIRKDAKGFHVALADGTVRYIAPNISADLFWALLTAVGRQPLGSRRRGRRAPDRGSSASAR